MEKEKKFNNNEIVGMQGYIPFNIMKGWINNNKIDSIFTYTQLTKFFKTYPIQLQQQILIDFGNSLIKEEDFYDMQTEMILKNLANKDNCYFEVSNISFIEYLVKNYPTIKIILHQNFTMFSDEKEILNVINAYKNNIVGIIITELNMCSKLKNITKYFLLTPKCCNLCQHFNFCINKEQQFTLDFSSKSAFGDCENIEHHTPDEIKKALSFIECNYPLIDYVICDTYDSNIMRLLEEQNIIKEIIKGA